MNSMSEHVMTSFFFLSLSQMFMEMKEFCLSDMRTGSYDWSVKYNNDKYCDDVSVSPEVVSHCTVV